MVETRFLLLVHLLLLVFLGSADPKVRRATIQDGSSGRKGNVAFQPWRCNGRLLAPTKEQRQPAPIRILILVRGISYDRSYREFANNFERTVKNFRSHMVRPWRAQGHSVDVAISTYDNPKISEVKEAYSPVFSHVYEGDWRRRRTKIDLVLEGLEAVVLHGGSDRWDFIAVTRFDLEMKEPVTSFAVDFGKLNFPWRERSMRKSSWSRKMPRVADAMQLFNSSYLPAMIESSKRMRSESMRMWRESTYDNLHRVLMWMDVDIDKEVNFLFSGVCPSRWNRPNEVYREAVSAIEYKRFLQRTGPIIQGRRRGSLRG